MVSIVVCFNFLMPLRKNLCAKVLLFFEIRKYFVFFLSTNEANETNNFFGTFWVILD